jgi:hypothetical protein
MGVNRRTWAPLGLLATVAASLIGPTAHAAQSPAPQAAGWKLLHSENFNQPFSTDSSPWKRYDYNTPVDTIMDDGGDWWKNDYGPAYQNALNSFATYRKTVKFGKGGWLTAALSARDWKKAGTPQSPPTISTEKLPGQESALKLNSPDSYDGAMITTSSALPSEYRLEYHLKTLDFGGKRNGTINYDGKVNGYKPTPGECKTQFPYAEGIGSKGWNSQITTNPCDWQSVVDGPFGYNAFHLMGIVDFANPQPSNLHFWHYRRKILMDTFSQHPDRIGTGTGGNVCDANTNTYYNYRDSTYNPVDMWVNGLPNFNPPKGGITGNSQWFMTSCSNGQASNKVSPSAAAELDPKLMPGKDYVFAVERNATGYTEEVTGDFLNIGHRTFRFYTPFTGGPTPIWHYNNSPSQYDGRYDNTLTQNGVYKQQQWPHQWPAGSAYPDFPVIGDPYTDAGEGSASVDSIRLFVPQKK